MEIDIITHKAEKFYKSSDCGKNWRINDNNLWIPFIDKENKKWWLPVKNNKESIINGLKNIFKQGGELC